MRSTGQRSGGDNLELIRSHLRNAGVRATPARIAVLREVSKAQAPVTHASVSDVLAPFGFDKATVFRNLNDLADAGLLHRTELGDHVWRFELIDPNKPGSEKHPHFVCVDCGSVTCLGEMEFTAASKRRENAIGDISEILIKGHCTNCLE